jgi:curli biogenesis system outer membrane secretion channel CsgG
VFKFVDVGTKLVEAEAGMTENEANTMAVKMAIEEAVIQLIMQGIDKGYFKFDPTIKNELGLNTDDTVTRK